MTAKFEKIMRVDYWVSCFKSWIKEFIWLYLIDIGLYICIDTKTDQWHKEYQCIFLDPCLSEGVLSNHPCLSVLHWSISGPHLKIWETGHCFSFIFCMMLGHHKGTKVTEPDFWKKILGVSQMGEKPHFGGIFDVFCHISASSY